MKNILSCVTLFSIFLGCSKSPGDVVNGDPTKQVAPTEASGFRLPANEEDYSKIGQCVLKVVSTNTVATANGYPEDVTYGEFNPRDPKSNRTYVKIDLPSIINLCPRGSQIAVPSVYFAGVAGLPGEDIKGTLYFNCLGPCSKFKAE